MKYTDNLLMVVAGYSLYTLTLGLSSQYFSSINQLIPDIFSEPISITLSQTFHQIVGSIFTGMLLVRFRARPILLAFVIAIIVNFEIYFRAFNKDSFNVVMDHYMSHPVEFISLLKPLVILPVMTFLFSLINRAEQAEEGMSE